MQKREHAPVMPRAFAAAPDAITASLYLVAWIAPTLPGPEAVKNLMLTMLIEFIVMHSSGFFAILAATGTASRGKRIALLTGFTCFYLLFVLAFSIGFDSIWPIFAFAWLLLSRSMHIWTHPSQSDGETGGMFLLLAASLATYVIGAAVTVSLPLPPLGITPDFVASMHLTGGGEWIERPYTVLAFGAIYFAVQAWVKYALAGNPAVLRPLSATSTPARSAQAMARRQPTPAEPLPGRAES
jgi:hypothetical protein